MFEVKNVSVNIRSRQILSGVSLTVEPGELVALLGPNGAGKSTLLKTMCGDVRVSGGEISLDGRALGDWHYHEIARKRAILSQHSDLQFPFTAREVVLLGRNPHVRGGETREDLEIVREAMSLVEADRFAGQSYTTLSGGERQRVHLARVLTQIWQEPADGRRYLLLDEPTSSLDLAHQHLTLRVARQFSRAGTAVVIVLHDLNLAAAYADRVCLMKHGRVRQTGTPQEILNADSIGEVFDFEVSVLSHGTRPLVVPRAAGMSN